LRRRAAVDRDGQRTAFDTDEIGEDTKDGACLQTHDEPLGISRCVGRCFELPRSAEQVLCMDLSHKVLGDHFRANSFEPSSQLLPRLGGNGFAVLHSFGKGFKCGLNAGLDPPVTRVAKNHAIDQTFMSVDHVTENEPLKADVQRDASDSRRQQGAPQRHFAMLDPYLDALAKEPEGEHRSVEGRETWEARDGRLCISKDA